MTVVGASIGVGIIVIGAIVALAVVFIMKKKTNAEGNTANKGNYILIPW